MFRKAINTMFHKDSLLFLLLTGFRLQKVHLFINPRTRMSEQKRTASDGALSRSSQHQQAVFSHLNTSLQVLGLRPEVGLPSKEKNDGSSKESWQKLTVPQM